MRLQRFLIIIFLWLPDVIFARQSPTHFILKGEVSGAEEAAVTLKYETGLHNISYATQVKDGKFAFAGEVKGIAYATLVISKRQLPERMFRVFIEPGSIHLVVNVNNPAVIQITGSAAEDAFLELQQHKTLLAEGYRRQLEALNAERDSAKYNELKTALSPYYDAADWLDIAYVAKHPEASISVYLLDLHQEKLIIDTAEAYFNKLPPSLKTSSSGLSLVRKFAERRKGEVGQPAFPFTARDVNGQNVNLAAYKGKYVLLDFWASWCLPCRIANPHLVRLYQQLHSKGIEFIGIADDMSTQKEWKAAIRKDKIGIWKQLLAGPESDRKLTTRYGVFAYPTKILIDPQGIIIGRYGEDEQEFDMKLKQIFDKK